MHDAHGNECWWCSSSITGCFITKNTCSIWWKIKNEWLKTLSKSASQHVLHHCGTFVQYNLTTISSRAGCLKIKRMSPWPSSENKYKTWWPVHLTSKASKWVARMHWPSQMHCVSKAQPCECKSQLYNRRSHLSTLAVQSKTQVHKQQPRTVVPPFEILVVKLHFGG